MRGAIHTKERSHVAFGDHGAGPKGGTAARVGLPAARSFPARTDAVPEYGSLDERFPFGVEETDFDSIEEVDAVARGLRRKAVQYSIAILILLLVVPGLAWLEPRWFAGRIWGGFTLNFLTVAVLLHIAFVVVAILYTRVANRSEDEMLGRLRDDT